MEFYGFEATILTKARPRSILMTKIHKIYIAGYDRSIFAMSNAYGSSTLYRVTFLV